MPFSLILVLPSKWCVQSLISERRKWPGLSSLHSKPYLSLSSKMSWVTRVMRLAHITRHPDRPWVPLSASSSATGFLRNLPWMCMMRWIGEKMMLVSGKRSAVKSKDTVDVRDLLQRARTQGTRGTGYCSETYWGESLPSPTGQ